MCICTCTHITFVTSHMQNHGWCTFHSYSNCIAVLFKVFSVLVAVQQSLKNQVCKWKLVNVNNKLELDPINPDFVISNSLVFALWGFALESFTIGYRVYPCISRLPILEPKNKFFLFLGENFLEKLILHLRTFFQACYSYTKEITASLDVKFIIVHTRVLKLVLVTQV